jgi:hypothetical protein
VSAAATAFGLGSHAPDFDGLPGVDESRTPQAFLLDRERKLRYRGRIADSRDPARVTRLDLRCAVEDLLAAREVEVSETEPVGCAIVW